MRVATLFFIGLIALAFAEVEDPDVLVLTSDNFDAEIAKNPPILVEFYAPWFGHFKNLAPEYAKAATELKGEIAIAKVNADDDANRPLASRFGIQGFPTLKVFRNGKPTDYAGERNAQSIVSYMRRQNQPAITLLNTVEEVNTFSQKDRVAVVGFFDSDKSADYATFAKTAEELRDSVTFGAVVGKSNVNKELGVEGSSSVILFKQFDEGKNVLPAGEFSNLSEFVTKNSVPLIDEIGPHNFKSYMEAKLPLAYLFVDLTKDGEKDDNINKVKDLAKETKGKLNWIYINSAKYGRHGERLGLSGKVSPAIAIDDMESGFHYAFDEKAEITTEAVKTWVNKYLAKELEPTIKSEDIPEKNDGPVKVVVAKNYDSLVLDKTKDVLVEFYAPWCGHCKKLAPIYEELGAAFAEDSNVVIAKMDATANDVDPKLGVRGFPTLKFFPANDKTPIEYNGDRSKEDLIQFVKSHSTGSSSGKDEL